MKNTEVPVFEQLIKNFEGEKPEKTNSETFIFQLEDTTSLPKTCRQLLDFFHEKSHLAASVETFREGFWTDSLTAVANLHLGPEMRWLQLRLAPQLDERWLAAAGFRSSDFSGKIFHHETVLKMQRQLLEAAENNGYPFAETRLDSIEISADGNISAILQFARNQYFTIGKIKNQGDLRLPEHYLPVYLGLKNGSPYDRSKILRIRERLRDLPFLETVNNPTVTFAGSEATVNVFLKKKKVSRFDFIIGLLPQSNATDGRLLLTGNLNTSFQNALGLGERFSAELERLRPETQRLDIQAGVPYLFGFPFGLEGRLNIFRRDSTWVDALGDLGVQYFFGGADNLRFFWENKSTYLQKVDTAALLKTRKLPANLDFRQNSFGLESNFSRLDYRFNPRRGWSVLAKGAAGFSTVRRNGQIENLKDYTDPNFSFSTLYDSLAQRAARFRVELKSDFYLPIFKRSTLKFGLRGGALVSPERPVFANEQFRIGGNKLMRGFNEEGIFATNFAVGTLEYRLLIGQNSWLAAFTDAGYVENVTDRVRNFSSLLGSGVGMTFETRGGIFGISIAIGKLNSEAFDFRAPKFHLGYVSLF